MAKAGWICCLLTTVLSVNQCFKKKRNFYLAMRFVYYIFVVHIFKPYSRLTKRSKSKKSAGIKDHMLTCDQLISFDDFKVLASSNSEFHLKIKESLLISRDQPVLNKQILHKLHKFFTVLWLFNFTFHTLLFTFHCFQRQNICSSEL